MSVLLASTSPRRKALLEQVGLVFDVVAVDVDESPQPNEVAQDYVARMAEEKSQAALVKYSNHITDSTLIITADTIGFIKDANGNEHILVKPCDFNDAKRMWQLMSARTHTVTTSVCVASKQKRLHQCVSTEVEFITLTDTMQQAYWQTGEPQDKAGAYAIQGRGAAWVKRIHGSYANVVGLPLVETLAMIASLKT